MRYYGNPVIATGHVGLGESQVTFDQFLCVILGALLGSWNWMHADISVPLTVIKEIDQRIAQQPNPDTGSSAAAKFPVIPKCLRLLGDAVKYYEAVKGPEKHNLLKMIYFGRRKAMDLFFPGTQNHGQTSPVFNLTNLNELSKAWRGNFTVGADGKPENRLDNVISFLRRWAATAGLRDHIDDAVIVYLNPEPQYTDLFPYKKRTNDGQLFSGGGMFRFWTQGNNISAGLVFTENPGGTVFKCFGDYDQGRTVFKYFDDASEKWFWGSCKSQQAVLERILLPPGPGKPAVDYHFLCGDKQCAAIFVPQAKISNLRVNLGWARKDCNLNLKHFLTCLKDNVIHREQGIYVLRNFLAYEQGCSTFRMLLMLTRVNEVYRGLQGSVVDLSVIKTMSSTMPKFFQEGHNVKKHNAKVSTHNWFDDEDILCQPNIDVTQNLPEMSLPVVFSCLIFFETGSIDLVPTSLEEAFAVSIQNSFYVADSLILDPSVSMGDQKKPSIKRITGNLGKPGVAILISPPDPRVGEVGFGTWNISYEPFDNSLVDNFVGTSCHLSLTGYEHSVDTSNHGFRNSECKFVETVVSVFDRGKWIADLDLSGFINSRQDKISQCITTGACDNKSHFLEGYSPSVLLTSLLCVDSWTALLDAPEEDLIVRAYGNFEARLAAVCLTMQKRKNYQILIISGKPCWDCVERDLKRLGFENGQEISNTKSEPTVGDFSITSLHKDRVMLIC